MYPEKLMDMELFVDELEFIILGQAVNKGQGNREGALVPPGEVLFTPA